MSSNSLTAGGGHHRFRLSWLLGLLALMAALIVGRSLTRADTKADTAHRQRGLDYEDHVFAPENLPHDVHREGGTLALHPAIYVPRIEVPARYYAAPAGHDGELVPHEPRRRPRPWRSVHTAGAARIPDAIETRADRTQVLYELKCPSPWLVFTAGTPWATKMQTAFASQAAAFLVWAGQAPNREVVYGFCGWVPPWAEAILRDLTTHLQQPVTVRAAYMADGFQPAERLVGRAAVRQLANLLGALALDELAGAAYDQLKD
jgi:hypothetical protein